MRITTRATGACLGLLALFSTSCADKTEKAAAPIPRVKVYEIGKQASGQSRRLSGKIEAADKSTLSFGVGGKITEIIASTGQVVTEGQLLATLDPAPFELEVQKARASVNSSRAKQVETKAKFERTKSLFSSKGASQQELDAATAALATAEGDVESSKRTLQRAEFDLARTKLTAPFAGSVSEIPVDPFQEVGANTGVVVLQAEGALKVKVRVPETMIRDVDYGQVVRVGFPSLPDVELPGTVATIGVESESGNAFPVTIRLAPTEADVRPGMTASVTFNFSAYLDGRTAFLMPLSAIAIDVGLRERGMPESGAAGEPGRAPVFVFDPETKTVVERQVLVGDLRGNEVEVFEGLQPGDLVVSAGVPFVIPGMRAEVWVPTRGAAR